MSKETEKNKRQTAVDWLIEQYNLYRPGQTPLHKFSEVCENAKEMERQQRIKDYNTGYEDASCNHINDAENYFNEQEYLNDNE